MAKAQVFYKKPYGNHVGATALLVTSFLALVFLCCGTPLGVLMELGEKSRSCNTLWGYRPNCWNAAYGWRVEEDTCTDRRTRWEAAEAFIIIALFSLLFNIGCAWAMLGGAAMKTATTLVAVFSVATTTVPWAIVTSLYYTHYCGDYTFTHFNRTLGIGYILMIVSFAIQCVGILLFLFLEPEVPVEISSKEEKKSLKESSTTHSSSSSHTEESD